MPTVTTQRILIVDTDPDVTSDLTRRLGAFGYRVETIASSEPEVTARLTHPPPDLIVMDMALRDDIVDGTTGSVRRGHWEPPVLFLVDEADEEAFRRSGLDEGYDCLVVPFTDRELRATVALALCRHKTSTAVHALEDRFFDTSVDLLCALDFSGYFSRVSPSWERALGFSRQELMSRPFIEFVHPDDRERTLGQNAAVRGGGQALAFENRYVCKDGSYRWLLWNAAPDPAERIIYSVARDVTASKQAQDERERLVRQLQDALSEVRTLQDILPICSYCRKIRDDENYWHTVESYLGEHTKTRFSHGICPSCMAKELGRDDAGAAHVE